MALLLFTLFSLFGQIHAMQAVPLAITWSPPNSRGGRDFLAAIQRAQREAMDAAEAREAEGGHPPPPDNPYGQRIRRQDRRMFKMIPPTVIESNICPYWWLQSQCSSMRDHNPRACSMVHPEFIDYDVSDMPEAREWCWDPELTRGQFQWMVNVQRCRFFARTGTCRWGRSCDKGHANQPTMANI